MSKSKSSDKSYTYYKTYKYPPKQNEKDTEHKPYNNSYKYPPQQKNDSYDDKKKKQEQPKSVYKYKIERDESGNSRYVLEEPISNPLKLINDYDIVCVYPSNGTKYYKNVNIYNYKKKIII